ncbi:MAG TPA: nitroreductase [Calditrichaeota bacterium]|nr:nitroreductase [Calditrichota bacterium]
MSIDENIKNRWSPRAFVDKPVEKEKLQLLFEAARWSASCYNEQPWRFIVGIKGQDEAYEKIFDTLASGNQEWCRPVPVLVAVYGKSLFSHNNKPNDWYQYDVGQAAATLAIQATALGIFVHPMAGFEPQRLTQLFSVPKEYKAQAIIAVGYPGDVQHLPEKLREMELAERKRKELREIVFSGQWEKPFSF